MLTSPSIIILEEVAQKVKRNLYHSEMTEGMASTDREYTNYREHFCGYNGVDVGVQVL